MKSALEEASKMRRRLGTLNKAQHQELSLADQLMLVAKHPGRRAQ